MRIIALLASLALIVLTLIDTFETILQPRRVMHRFRYARFFYRTTWWVWRRGAMLMPRGKMREGMLSGFGPLSLLGLFATWVLALLIGFGLLHWVFHTPVLSPESVQDIRTYLYLSGTTLFTLGYGDVTPTTPLGRGLAVVESGLGFAFLAVIISYLPVLYQAFSRREVTISLMDARAGSPPSAGQFLLRLARAGNMKRADTFLAEWERWAAELLESHLSFPVLSYYRSQHDNQSWLATLATILDTSSLLIAEIKTEDTYQAQLTFAMARHAAVDLALVLKTPPKDAGPTRATPQQREKLKQRLREAGVKMNEGAEVDEKLAELRGMYEPFLAALAERFIFTLPPLAPEDDVADNWQRSAWMNKTPGIGELPERDDDHF